MSEFREGFVGENPDGPTVEETVFKNLVDRKFPESRSKYESLFKKKDEGRLRFERENEEFIEQCIQEARKIVSTFDCAVLQAQFDLIAKKCGKQQLERQVVPPERIIIEPVKFVGLGFYDSEGDRIIIDVVKIIQEFPKFSLEQIKSLFLHALIHEQVHAVSTVVSPGPIEPDEFTTGYQKGFSMVLWNEGVTESIAREVGPQYKHQLGLGADLYSSGKKEVYKIPVRFVKEVVEHIAKKVGIPSDTVWGAIKRGYFDHTLDYYEYESKPDKDGLWWPLPKNEAELLFNEIVTESFLDKLGHATLNDMKAKGLKRFEGNYSEFRTRHIKEELRAELWQMIKGVLQLVAGKLGLQRK